MNSAMTWGHLVGQLQVVGRPPRGTARQPHALCTASCAIARMHHLSGAAGMSGLSTAPQYCPLWWKKVPLQGAKTALCWTSLQWQGFFSSSKDIFLGPDSAVGPRSRCSSTISCAAKVCHEAWICTGPWKLPVTTASTCRVCTFLARVEQPIILAKDRNFDNSGHKERAWYEAWTRQAWAALTLFWNCTEA